MSVRHRLGVKLLKANLDNIEDAKSELEILTMELLGRKARSLYNIREHEAYTIISHMHNESVDRENKANNDSEDNVILNFICEDDDSSMADDIAYAYCDVDEFDM